MTALVIYCAIHCFIIDSAIIAGVIKVYTTKHKIKKATKAFRKES